MKHARRNYTALLLTIAAIFSAAAIQVFSGFLEPSQPPAVAVVQMGGPRDDADGERRAAERRETQSPRSRSVRSPGPGQPAPIAD